MSFAISIAVFMMRAYASASAGLAIIPLLSKYGMHFDINRPYLERLARNSCSFGDEIMPNSKRISFELMVNALRHYL